MLLAVPNISEGRDAATIEAVGAAFEAAGARVLDIHADPDHNRSVFTMAAEGGKLAEAVVNGAREAIERIDLTSHQGVHPRVGAVDVAPVVHLDADSEGLASAEALVLGDMLGSLGLPVYLYGSLARGRTRAELRRPGGLDAFSPDFGPKDLHPSAGAILVAARPPLVAFNLELAPPATEVDAKAIAALIREGGAEGLPSVRALGVSIRGGVAQVTTNIEDHTRTTATQVLDAVRRHARVARAELVALTPAAAFENFPDDVPLSGLRTIESALMF